MKKLILPFVFLSLQVYSSPCPSELARTYVIQNDYRESSVSNLANLYNNNYQNGTFYNGDGQQAMFSLGFARGLWVGGLDPNDNLMVSISTYNNSRSDFGCGPVYTGQEDREERCAFFTRAWKVTKSQVDVMRNAYAEGNLTADKIPDDILMWPAKGNPHITVLNIAEEMAPFYDNDGDGIYDPLEGDYPLALKESPDFVPHQFRFYVINDLELHTNSFGDPLTMEFHVCDYVVACTEDTESEKSVFSRITYINRGVEDIRKFKIAIWDDTDLGCYNNDYIGCSRELNCSYTYNVDGVDQETADCAETIAVPESTASVRSLIFLNKELESFRHYQNGGVGFPAPQTVDPGDPVQFYNYLDGYWLDGTPMTRGGNGYNPGSTDTTKFLFPDLPNEVEGWSMQQEAIMPQDMRTLSIFSDVDLVPGARGTFDFVDHVLIDSENIGLDVFDIYATKVNEVKQEFEQMTKGEFNCGNNIMSASETSSPNNLVNIYPNPSSTTINIALQKNLSGLLKIYSIEGTKVFEQTQRNTRLINVDVSAFTAGFYVAAFEDENGVISTSYFVKD